MKTQILSLAIMLVLSIAATSPAFSQAGGTIKGTILDSETKQPIPYASAYVKYGDNLISAAADFDGNFTIKPVPPGTYTLTISRIGYGEKALTGVKVSQEKITFVNNIEMTAGILMKTVEVFPEPVIDPEKTGLKTIEAGEIQVMANNRNINSLIGATSSDIQVSDNDDEIYFRGSRSGDALYIIDGMRMINPSALCPSIAIGTMSVYTGGVPAKYGDFTGGVIVIETQSYFEWLAAQESERLRNGGL
jgi:hypothetical protein